MPRDAVERAAVVNEPKLTIQCAGQHAAEARERVRAERSARLDRSGRGIKSPTAAEFRTADVMGGRRHIRAGVPGKVGDKLLASIARRYIAAVKQQVPI